MAYNIGWNTGEEGMAERIYFFKEKIVLEMREIARKEGLKNPFRHSKRTVYRKEVEDKLKS